MVQTRAPDKRKASAKTSPPEPPAKKPEPSKRVVSKTKVSKTTTPKKTPPRKAINPIETTNEVSIPISEQDILQAQESGELLKVINSLTNTAQDELFTTYKQKVQQKLDQDEHTIIKLQQQLEEKERIIKGLKETIIEEEHVAKKDSELFISPIRKRRNIDEEVINRDDITKELNTVGVILDMIQLLTGLKVINHDQDDLKFYFDVLQSSTVAKGNNVSMEYRLVIVKKFSAATEVNYIPTFLEDETKDKLLLKKYLPDYFCDRLTFPYHTLSQFYSKMNKALNRIASI